MKLMINGKEAEAGMTVTDFRGDNWELESWKEPVSAGSTGRVYVSNGGCRMELSPR